MTSKIAVYFTVLTVLSALMLVPGFAVIIIIFTLGLGLPLMAVHSLYLYSILLLTAYLSLKAGQLFLAAALLAPAIIVAAYPKVVTSRLQRAADQLATGDISRNHKFQARHLQFKPISDPLPSFYSNLAAAPCAELCQRLLLEGVVDQITVVPQISESRFMDKKPFNPLTYGALNKADCSTAFEAQGHLAAPIAQETIKARESGRCIQIVDPVNSPELTITFNKKIIHKDPKFFEGSISEIGQISIASTANSEKILQKTFVKGTTLRSPFLLGMFSGYGLSPRFDAARKPFLSGDLFDEEAVVRQFLSAPQLSKESVQPTRRPTVVAVSRLLDQLALSNETKNFGPDIDRLLDFQPIDAEPSEAEIQVFDRVLRDVRIVGIAFVQESISKRSAVVERLLPAILTRLEKFTTSADQLGSMQYLADSVARLPIEKLKPFSARIAALVARDGTPYLDPLTLILGLLDGDVTSILAKRMLDPSQERRQAAYEAVCRAEPMIIDQMQPQILHALESRMRAINGQSDYRSGDTMYSLLVALKRIGREKFIDDKLPDYSYFVRRLNEEVPAYGQPMNANHCGLK